jgi:5-methylcytosine-specific restriction endonuclease McrA
MNQRWTKENLEQAVAISKNNREVCYNLGLLSGSSQTTLNHYLEIYQIDTSHFETVKDRRRRSKRLTSKQVLIEHSPYKRTTVKNHFIKAGAPYQCAECGLTNSWRGKTLSLQLDHIDGDGTNNSLGNLRWLCPNCHSQTETFSGKNTEKQRLLRNNPYTQLPEILVLEIPWPSEEELRKEVEILPLATLAKKLDISVSLLKKRCLDLNIPVKPRGYWRKLSEYTPTKIEWPTKEELEILVHTHPTSTIAKQLGVSDVAISKRCKKFGIEKPGRGYWTKQISVL